MMGVGLAVERDVVDPHVEVGPVNANEENHTSQRSMATGPRQNEADANGDFHDAGDEHPNGWVAKNRWDNRLKPRRIREMLNANVDVHQTENSG